MVLQGMTVDSEHSFKHSDNKSLVIAMIELEMKVSLGSK